jgi:PHD/YefM family antitoxin component YafN of YafNO toxin-antitoxin module
MLTVKENTTLVGVSELRKGIERILGMTRKGLVIVEKRHKPTAVLMSNTEYEHLQQMLETAEDIVLGFIASQRFKTSKEEDYIDIEKLLK